MADDPTRSLAASCSVDGYPAAPREIVLGDTIGRYQIRRLLGAGGMGRVYLARDVVLGRSIALKLVGGAIPTGRFLHEACTIAKLNHPNIVQLYDFGEHRGAIYLALEYVAGVTLRDRMHDARSGVGEALHQVRAIADALAHAHAFGVVHCDLKPSNVMVGHDGRIRVVDFGIARTADDLHGARGGTPDWMAPEQWKGGALTDRVDSWALGIVTAQLLTGRHPLGDSAEERRAAVRDPGAVPRIERRNLPAPIAELIQRALEHAPALRPSASEWKRVIDDVLANRGEPFDEDGPYPGLAAFDESHARFYFGREQEIDAFLERLRDAPHLPIVGPSGAGKSSFLHAGVIPRLRARAPWTVISLRPGSDPVGALARHLILAMTDARDRDVLADLALKASVRALRADLLETPTLLAARLATLAATRGSHVLIAVDQLEEAFTQGAPEPECARFLEMLLGAADDPLDPVRVVFTLRDDFLGRLVGLRSLFVIHRLALDDLRRTITGPLQRYGFAFDDPTIVDDLLAELGNADADLPLLQFACRTLWEGRDAPARLLRRATYDRMGGLAGALARHAENALAELTADEHRIARQLLLHLVFGTTRRSVPRDQLESMLGPSSEPVIDRLLSARLLVQRQVDGESSIIEIAHESLLQTWSQLARWIGESRDERRLLEELEDATSLWERRGRRSEETWSQGDLATARHRAAQLGLAFPAHVRAFLAAGDARHHLQRRRRRWRYGIAAVASAIVALVAIFWIGNYLAREQMIQANAGTVDLVIAAYDWSGGKPIEIAIDQLPSLSWSLYASRPGDPHEPGPALPSGLVHRLSTATEGKRKIERVRAPGGLVFLKLEGRGRRGERCAPSWIRIQAFPGYAGPDEIPRFEIAVPTCQASRADMVTIEAGEFVYGGRGDPPSAHRDHHDYNEEREIVNQPRFTIDRTEISNAVFEPFARLAAITGYPRPIYSNDPVHARDGDPAYPVSEIDAFEAMAFCRFMGKTLPSDHQWVKAARGGLEINGVRNKFPERLYPWGGGLDPACANQAGLDDGYRWVAPVTEFACGASPYGILNLSGNVQEWIARSGQTDRDRTPHHAMRGGAADSPPALELASTVFRNHADPRSFGYSMGARCVVEDDLD